MRISNKATKQEIQVGDVVYIKAEKSIFAPTDKNGVRQNVAYVEQVGKNGVTVSFEVTPCRFTIYTMDSVELLEGVKFVPSWKKPVLNKG